MAQGEHEQDPDMLAGHPNHIHPRSLKEAEVSEAEEMTWFQPAPNSAKGRKLRRQKEAQERAEVRATRSDEEQLKILVARGVTRGREIDRLRQGISGSMFQLIMNRED